MISYRGGSKESCTNFARTGNKVRLISGKFSVVCYQRGRGQSTMIILLEKQINKLEHTCLSTYKLGVCEQLDALC